MTQRTGQRATRGKPGGFQISRLAFELLQSNGIDVLGRMCANEALSLPNRLKVVDTAITVKLTSREELVDHGAAPTPEDFGIRAPDGHQPAAQPWWRGIARFRSWRRELAAKRAFAAACRRHAALDAAKAVLARERDIRIYDRCSGPEFEALVARAFRAKGFRVEQVGGANDGGIDLLVWKGNRHAIVQCKAHAKPVGPAVLRDLLGALRHTAEAEIAFLATTNGVSSNALAWSADKPIVVLTPDHLVRGRLHL